LTPAEFNGFSAILAKKREAEVELMKASAYWAESLARTKRLPDFDKWLNPPKPARVLKGKEAEKRLQEHNDDVAMIEGLMAAKKKNEEGLTDG
tara:strand:- start:154 stop:432 length:279 start_codon:yes stop_codon:yes gene_type:complete